MPLQNFKPQLQLVQVMLYLVLELQSGCNNIMSW
jgi:hypothetical protein